MRAICWGHRRSLNPSSLRGPSFHLHAMALESLSPEILLITLEYISSPLDLIAAVHASPSLYRTFIAYKHHLQGNTLTRAIHPTCRADAYSALDVQRIPQQIKSGTKIAKLKAEC